MKNIFLLLILAGIIAQASGQNNPKALNLIGSWKETARSTADKQPVPYTDTIRIDFLVGNEYTWGKANSFIYRGTYKVKDKTLELGARVYTITSAAGDQLLLQDDAGLHEFSRYKKASTATDNSHARSGDRAQMQDEYNGVKEFRQLVGNWQVYKRTSAVQQKAIDYATIVKSVSFSSGKDGEQGRIFAAKDPEGAPSWYVDRFKDNTLYCKGKGDRTFKVLKCAGGELILQEGDMTYFFKQFQ